jgi:hypothetical protein
MPAMVRMDVPVDVTPMRHDGTTGLDAPGVCHLILVVLQWTSLARALREFSGGASVGVEANGTG